MAEDLPAMLPIEGADVVWHPELDEVTLALIEAARHHVYVAQFIVAATVTSDRTGRVEELVDALGRAQRRGVDVRVLVSPFRSDEDPWDLNHVAVTMLTDVDVPVREWTGSYRRSLHSKYIVQDDQCSLVGSCNWSNGGLGGNIEAAALVWSNELTRLLATEFRRGWRFGEEIEVVP